ncbi:MAG: RHS repeat-associated core domain-containing protein [Proteobacteria bacterium]|nr:RHS repeat-associated core domain-containing protein [Pseudomonadota bacterium]
MSLNGSLVAIRRASLGGTNWTTAYEHTDALRSPVHETDANANPTTRGTQWFTPFGEPSNGSYLQGPGYAGHVSDAASHLTYAQQRYYDPVLGRFLSPDPVQADDKGGDFNRYWYANNNPYKFTDKDGRAATIPGQSCIAGVFCRQYSGQLDGIAGNQSGWEHRFALAAGGKGQNVHQSNTENHSSVPISGIDYAKWRKAGEISEGNSISVDSRGGIIIQPRSIAFPPTFQFVYRVKQLPIDGTGKLLSISASDNWFKPVTHGSGFTGNNSSGGFLFSALGGPGGNRWYIQYPYQASTHDNVADSSLIIYTPVPAAH